MYLDIEAEPELFYDVVDTVAKFKFNRQVYTVLRKLYEFAAEKRNEYIEKVIQMNTVTLE